MYVHTDNSDTANDLFKAIDNHGLVDKLLRAMYSAAAVMGGQEIGQLRLLGGYQEIQECTSDYPGGPSSFPSGIEAQDFSLAADVIEDLGLLTMDPATSRTVLMFMSRHIILTKCVL